MIYVLLLFGLFIFIIVRTSDLKSRVLSLEEKLSANKDKIEIESKENDPIVPVQEKPAPVSPIIEPVKVEVPVYVKPDSQNFEFKFGAKFFTAIGSIAGWVFG